MYLSTQGYVLVKAPEGHPNAYPDGRILAHRLIAEQKIGRALMSNEVCHHINWVKTDNRPENIEVILRRNHPSEHGNPQAVRESTKTHCPHGHPYDEANTYYHPKGRRVCRICSKEAMKRFRNKNGGGHE